MLKMMKMARFDAFGSFCVKCDKSDEKHIKMTGFGMFMGPGDIRTRHAIESTLETWLVATPINSENRSK